MNSSASNQQSWRRETVSLRIAAIVTTVPPCCAFAENSPWILLAVRARDVVTPHSCAQMRALQTQNSMINAPSVTASAAPNRQVAPSYLRRGYQLTADLTDATGSLLCPAGGVIDADLIKHLDEARYAAVFLSLQDWENITILHEANSLPGQFKRAVDPRDEHTKATEQLDAVLRQVGGTEFARAHNPYSELVKTHGATDYNPKLVEKHSEQHLHTIDQICDLIHGLNNQERFGGDHLARMSHDSVVQAAEDMDLFVSLGIRAEERDSIFAHSACVSKLAIAMGVQLGFNSGQLNELGAGCLVHDAGMMQIDESIRNANRELTTEEFTEVARHPIIAADMLYERVDRVPVGVRMVVYQMHERCDGSGYPRGCTGDKIHALAKVASVADAYVAMVSDRPYRPAMKPYQAIKTILEGVPSRKFDPQVVRALINAVSIFPIGSYVELSDGRIGQVLRANGGEYASPILHAWRRDSPKESKAIVDLRRQPIEVVRTLSRQYALSNSQAIS